MLQPWQQTLTKMKSYDLWSVRNIVNTVLCKSIETSISSEKQIQWGQLKVSKSQKQFMVSSVLKKTRTKLTIHFLLYSVTKGQLISKWFFGVVDFLKKTSQPEVS